MIELPNLILTYDFGTQLLEVKSPVMLFPTDPLLHLKRERRSEEKKWMAKQKMK